MSYVGRAWRSVIRKPVKSILLLLIVFVISLLMLSAMASKSANIATQDESRQALGAGLLLEGNESNRHKRITEATEKIGENMEGYADGVEVIKMDTIYGTQWMISTDNSFESLQIDDIEKIASVSGIEDYNITTAVLAVNPVNFIRIEDHDVDANADVMGVSLIGNRDMSMDANVLSGNLSIKEGRMIEKDDTDVCGISEELAAQNNLGIGDMLEFNDYHDRANSKVHAAEIIGNYRVVQKMTPYMSGDTYRSENVIFTDLRFPEKAEGNENNPLFAQAYFKVGNVDQYDSVKEAVKQVNINWERYDLIDNKGNLDTMSSNFNDLEKISQILIVVIAMASFIILFFVFVFWLKNRDYEIGIFMSLGISKREILGQILMEAFIIAILAIFISFSFAPHVSRMAADYLVTQQVQQAEEQNALDKDKVAVDSIQSEQEVTGVNVRITLQMMIVDGAGIMTLISLSVLLAGINILKKNPKEILSEIS